MIKFFLIAFCIITTSILSGEILYATFALVELIFRSALNLILFCMDIKIKNGF